MAQNLNNAEPTKFDKFWYKMEDKLVQIFLPIFSLVADAAVIYTIYWLFAFHIPYAALWMCLVLAITVPILYFFNRGAIEVIKGWFKKKDKKKEE